MSPSAGVDELLARLVAQFASPYDLLRELVQNAMDAGSDRVEVVLHTHEVADVVVFEIEVVDTGEGMDEAIIDGELTRLFASGKTGDRTMAGGFGIGFVSVFAWKPDNVLVQTGRGTEAWELQFFADRRFEKRRIDEPIEGTTVRLFRRGHAAERPAIARAIRDSLWRWCRFCPLEITFEDRTAGDVEVIREDPVPSDEVLAVSHDAGDTRIRVAFAVPPHAVLLRRGLVLAEGGPAEVLPHAAAKIAGSFDHLRVWADSSSLRTDIGRDHVIDDAGRASVERVVIAQVQTLRTRLLERLVALAGAAGEWTSEVHGEYAYLHAHLRCERDAIGAAIARAGVLRRGAGDGVAPADLARVAVLGVVAWREPTDDTAMTTVALAARAGVPTLVAMQADVDGWLGELLAGVQLVARPLATVVRDVTPTASTPVVAQIEQLVATAGFAGKVAIGKLGATADALWGLGIPAVPGVVVTGARKLEPDRGHTIWLDERHVLVRAANVHAAVQPVVAAAAIAFAIAGGWPGPALELGALVDAVDAMRAAEAS